VRVLVVEARGPDDLERAFAEMSDARAGALMVVATPLFVIERRRLAELSRRTGLPAMSEFREFAVEGGLITYGPSIADLNRRAAGYVAKILKGAKPADLPVEQPTKFELVINLKTAEALGLAVPHSLLARADEVIE
jgi:putative tryptophan/tyrosine transport system substrate-binding protein